MSRDGARAGGRGTGHRLDQAERPLPRITGRIFPRDGGPGAGRRAEPGAIDLGDPGGERDAAAGVGEWRGGCLGMKSDEGAPPDVPGGAIACETGSCERALLVQILGRGESAVGAATEPAAIRTMDRSSPTASWSARDLLDPGQKAEPRLFHGLDGPIAEWLLVGRAAGKAHAPRRRRISSYRPKSVAPVGDDGPGSGHREGRSTLGECKPPCSAARVPLKSACHCCPSHPPLKGLFGKRSKELSVGRPTSHTTCVIWHQHRSTDKLGARLTPSYRSVIQV